MPDDDHITIQIKNNPIVVKIEDQSNRVVFKPESAIRTIGIQGPEGPPGNTTRDYKERTGDYYLTFAVDDFVGMDASNGNCFAYLPISDLTNRAKTFKIKKIDSTSYSITVQANNGQILDNINSTFIIDEFNEEFEFISTGTGWKIA